MNIPASTYRLQLNKGFTFGHLKEIIPYLHELGVTTIYAAPVFSASAGSMHGYDVVDPHTINPEIGTEDELKEISALLEARGMTWLQDIVPNHMAFDTRNWRLMDVLERGSHSPFYNYFDIDWEYHDPDFKDKLMVPFLGKPFDECLEAGEIKLTVSDDGIFIQYFETSYPASITVYAALHEKLISNSAGKWTDDLLILIETRLKESSTQTWLKARRDLFAACVSDKIISAEIQRWVDSINGDKYKLKDLLGKQFYALMYWKDTEHKLNYRRFFTVNSLICLAMESDAVFDEYHQYIYSLYTKKYINGLRIDHIDGLQNPSAYVKKLRQLFGDDCYIIAEKILESKEEIPEHWSLEGTSGYEFLSIVNQLFTDRYGASKLVGFYHSLVPQKLTYDELVLQNKKMILDEHMGGELENLSYYFAKLGLQGGLTHEQVEHTLSALMLSWPVYRIYPERIPLSGTNLELLNEAFARAYHLSPALTHELNYFRDLFTLEDAQHPLAKNIIRFMKRMMQFTGPLTAKGVEDTTFYIYSPLISHVEVGDTPTTMGISVTSFHRRMARRMQLNPQSLNATATHDTKRGEDARMRLNLLSEHPDQWIESVEEWRKINAPLIKHNGAQRAPSVNDEYFIYQSMVGGVPEDFVISENWIVRLQEYMVKVVREAKVISNWSDPDVAYEDACQQFIREALTTHKPFIARFIPFVTQLCRDAEVYSVAQLIVKITTPGIPDLYQGTELFDLSYVDPDNRRPVDFQLRKSLLTDIKKYSAGDGDKLMHWLRSNAAGGARKLFTAFRMLNFRKTHSELFEKGAYIVLECPGSLLAYARKWKDEWLIVVIPLGINRKNKENADLPDIIISLPGDFPQVWNNIFTGENVTSGFGIALGRLIDKFPVVALYSGSSRGDELQ